MIAFPLGVKVWIAGGVTQMRRGMNTLAQQVNDIDPQACLADVIACISDMPASRLHELLPWRWNAAKTEVKAA